MIIGEVQTLLLAILYHVELAINHTADVLPLIICTNITVYYITHVFILAYKPF